jgi:hypothetical protein
MRALAVLTALVFAVTGCSPDSTATDDPSGTSDSPFDGMTEMEEDPESTLIVMICINKSTKVRVGYRGCDDNESGFAWLYLSTNEPVPAVGKKVKGGSLKAPKGEYMEFYRAPKKGGRLSDEDLIVEGFDSAQICVKTSTRIRVADRPCTDDEPGYAWYFINIDDRVPAVGKKAEYGSYREPAGETFRVRGKGGVGSEIAIDYVGGGGVSEECVDYECDDDGSGFSTQTESNRGCTSARRRSYCY